MSESTVPTPPTARSKKVRTIRPSDLREVLLASALLGAASLVVAGVAGWSPDLARIVGGVLLAGIAWLFLTEVG